MPLFRLLPTMLVALLGQILLLCHTYYTVLFHPGQYLIIDHYDGIKSYFSMASFLREPLSNSTLVSGQNYPFGEYIFYTDSTPLVIVPLHWLVQTVPALAPYGLYLFDVFILAGIVISTGLLVLILRRLTVPAWLTVLLAIALPWLGPQTIRLNVGHMNLAYTPATLFVFWRLQCLYLAWRAEKPLHKQFALLLVGIVGASWIHFYYLPLLCGILGFFVAVLLYESWRTHRPWRSLVVGGGITLVMALVLTWGLLQLLDPRRGERPTGSGGYDWIEWKFQFGALFRGYVFNKVRFPLERTAEIPYESSAYLTAFVLFGLLLVMVLLLIRRLPTAARLPQSSNDDNVRFLKYLVLASLPLALIALGETIDVDNGGYILHNYLNVFRWLHKITERVTQFRALGRFIWPFWWAVVLAFSWYVARWRHIAGLRWALVVLCTLLVVDTVNATHHYRTVTQRPNLLTSPESTQSVRQLVGWVDKGRYQAFLPLPFYHSGSDPEGDVNYSVDPDDPHCNATYQLSMITGLPMMSHKAARTPFHEAALLQSILRPAGPDPELLAKLDSRPILVFLDTAYYDGRNNFYREELKNRPEMLALFERADDFIRERQLRRIGHFGSRSLYEWFPKAAAPQQAQP